MIGILLHNELRLDAHWFTRNVLNAIGYATFDAGAMTVANSGMRPGSIVLVDLP